MSYNNKAEEKFLPDQNSWNYYPTLPIANRFGASSIRNLKSLTLMLFSNIVSLNLRLVCLFFSVFVWIYIAPDLTVIAKNANHLIVTIYACNLISLTFFAGFLHLYLHKFCLQGNYLKFGLRGFQKNNNFLFGDQVYDNIFWSLVSGVSIWTIYETLLLWMLALEIIPSYTWFESKVWFVGFLFLIPLIDSVHFFYTHKMLHSRWLYKLAHHIHHRNIETGPWSGISMHPVEHLIYFSPALIHIIVPSDPVHIIFHLSWLAFGPVISHSGFESMSYKKRKFLQLVDFFHNLHHKHFNCNYGNAVVPLDKLHNSFHNGTILATQAIRKSKISSK